MNAGSAKSSLHNVEYFTPALVNEPLRLSNPTSQIENTIKTKDSQIQNLQNELESKRNELDEIRNSVVFGITSGIAQKLGKLAPESTRRKKVLRSTRAAYLIQRDKGTKALLSTAKKKIIHPKTIDTKTKSNPQAYLHTLKTKSKLSSEIIKIEGKFEQDILLRKALQYESHNITKLSSYPKVSIIIITFNQVDALKRNLNSIKSKSTYQNYEVIIVTNNHDENSQMRQFLKTVEHSVYIYKDEYSFGGMNNFGATKAKGVFLLF